MPEQLTKEELLKRLNGLTKSMLAIRMKIRDTQDDISENISNDDISDQIEMMVYQIKDLIDIIDIIDIYNMRYPIFNLG